MENTVQTILIAGGSGLIGNRIAELLECKNYNVCYLSRNPKNKDGNSFSWDPEKKKIDIKAIESADVIINLAGAGIADKRWTTSRKKLIIKSRLDSTDLLYETLANTPNKVKLVINASAIGIYGDTGVKIMNENSPLSDDYLGTTCQQWENAALRIQQLNIRVVIFRIGLVLSIKGGMLKELLKPLRMGIAPVFGNGKQYQSWIHIDDLCKMFIKAIYDKNMHGTYNAVAPKPLQQRNFIKLLAQIEEKKYITVRIFGFFMKLIMGEMANVVLQGSKVSSKKIESTGFAFRYPHAGIALRNALGK